MYKREFDSLLKKSLPNAVLLYGEEEYLLSFYQRLYRQKLEIDEPFLLYYDEYDFKLAREYLSQSSLFGDKNLLIIRTSVKIPKKELDSLVETTAKNSDSFLLIIFDGEAKVAKSLQSSFNGKSGNVWVRFFPLNRRETLETIKKSVLEIGVDIDDFTINYLLEVLDFNISLAIKELEKLAIFERKITKNDVDRFVYAISPISMDRLISKLFDKQDITSDISKILEFGSSEFEILRGVQIFVNQIFLFYSHLKIDGYPITQSVLGYKLPKNLEEQRVRVANRFDIETLSQIFEHLTDGELRLKRAKASTKETTLYSILISMQRLI